MATPTMSNPSPNATHGQRFDGSPGGPTTSRTRFVRRRRRDSCHSCAALAHILYRRSNTVWMGTNPPLTLTTRIRIGEDGGRAALLVDGVVQSISPEDGLANGGYWAAMVPDERPHRALILGLGGGTLARLLQVRWGELRIVGVDDDPSILETANSVGWLPLPGLDIVVADAFDYVAGLRRALRLRRRRPLPRRATGATGFRQTVLAPCARSSRAAWSAGGQPLQGLPRGRAHPAHRELLRHPRGSWRRGQRRRPRASAPPVSATIQDRAASGRHGMSSVLVLLVIVLGAGSILAVGFTIGLVFTLIMAGLVGWAADLVVPGHLPGGWFGAVLSGLIGGFIGTWLFGVLGVHEPGFELVRHPPDPCIRRRGGHCRRGTDAQRPAFRHVTEPGIGTGAQTCPFFCGAQRSLTFPGLARTMEPPPATAAFGIWRLRRIGESASTRPHSSHLPTSVF